VPAPVLARAARDADGTGGTGAAPAPWRQLGGGEEVLPLRTRPLLALRGGGRGLLGGMRKEQRVPGKAHKAGWLYTMTRTEEASAGSKRAKGARLAQELRVRTTPDLDTGHVAMKRRIRKRAFIRRLVAIEAERGKQEQGRSGPGRGAATFQARARKLKPAAMDRIPSPEAYIDRERRKRHSCVPPPVVTRDGKRRSRAQFFRTLTPAKFALLHNAMMKGDLKDPPPGARGVPTPRPLHPAPYPLAPRPRGEGCLQDLQKAPLTGRLLCTVLNGVRTFCTHAVFQLAVAATAIHTYTHTRIHAYQMRPKPACVHVAY
jgi:hypothetical protein